MENFSENPPARKRGRPRVFEDCGYEPEWQRNLSRAYTARSQMNNRYFKNALFFLTQDHPDRERYAWLCPDGATLHLQSVALRPSCRPKVKTALLTELGRIQVAYGEETMRQVALQLCEEKPKTQDAVRWLRRWRLQQEPQEGNAKALYDAIVRTIEDYLARYPAMPPEAIGAVLWALHYLWEDAPDQDDEDATSDEAPEPSPYTGAPASP